MAQVPYGFCHCGCGRQTAVASRNHPGRGWVKGEPVRYVPGHGARRGTVDFVENPETHCWLWQRSCNDKGYGMLGIGGRGRSGTAHRAFYEHALGPVPDGLELDHLCRNRSCVNPGHLEPVTHTENMRRGANSKLNSDQRREIRASCESLTALAGRFGVTKQAIAYHRKAAA